MEEYDSFSLMETKVMDNVLKKMWRGPFDTGGRFFAFSVCYKVLTKEINTDYQKDYERTHRLRCRGRIEKTRHHPYTFKVYKKAMDFRYYIELLLFILVAGAF